MCPSLRCWATHIASFSLLASMTGCPNLDPCLPTNSNLNANDNEGNSNQNTNTNDNAGVFTLSRRRALSRSRKPSASSWAATKTTHCYAITRPAGVHHARSAGAQGSTHWPQAIWRDQLIRFQPIGSTPTDAARIDLGEIVGVSLLTGETDVMATTENISLVAREFALAASSLCWRQIASDGLQRVMRLDLATREVQAVLEQPQIVADATMPDRFELVGATATRIFRRRFRRTSEPIPGHGHSQLITHEAGFFEHRRLDGATQQVLEYDYRFGVTGTTGAPPVAARLFGERVVWRDATVGDYVVMALPGGAMCRVNPFFGTGD